MNITRLPINDIDCYGWCQGQLEKIGHNSDYTGFALIVISILILCFTLWPMTGINNHRKKMVWFSIFLLTGFLIIRLWFN